MPAEQTAAGPCKKRMALRYSDSWGKFMVACRSCGEGIPETCHFCLHCGASIKPDVAASRMATIAIPSSTPSSNSLDEGRFLPGILLATRYRIVALLGRGGMGEVCRANDFKLGQPVALKFLPESATMNETTLARFYSEVRIARQVSHPNVCRVYDLGEVDGQPYLSMEYVDGEDLGSLMRRIGRLPEDKALEIARKLCAGLAAAHEKGVLHRDLKPAKVMLDGRGNVLITDFGLAALADQIQQGEVRNGTPAYMAPEQLAGKEVSARSDIYSLGLVLYEVFTGRRAFEASSPAELVRMHTETTPVSPSSLVKDLDPAVERVILRCLDPHPRNRPASALGVAGALPGGDPLAAALVSHRRQAGHARPLHPNVLQLGRMSHTITVRLTEELAAWLEETARRTGVPAGRIVREQLERARRDNGSQAFLRHAGKMEGPANLSSRKGFSRR